MIDITFSRVKGSGRKINIEAWLCGARVADAVRELPDYAPLNYFDTPEVRATMTDIAQPTVDRLRGHFAQPEPADNDADFLKRFKENVLADVERDLHNEPVETEESK